MPAEPTPGADYRVLILPPTRRDGEVTCAVLERAGMSCLVCDDAAALAEEIQAGVGAIVVTDAIAGDGSFARLTATLDRQPSWSDAPTVLLSRTNHLSSATTRLLAALRNVTVLDRPTSTITREVMRNGDLLADALCIGAGRGQGDRGGQQDGRSERRPWADSDHRRHFRASRRS